jgi:hypothetical protein
MRITTASPTAKRASTGMENSSLGMPKACEICTEPQPPGSSQRPQPPCLPLSLTQAWPFSMRRMRARASIIVPPAGCSRRRDAPPPRAPRRARHQVAVDRALEDVDRAARQRPQPALRALADRLDEHRDRRQPVAEHHVHRLAALATSGRFMTEVSA